MYIKKENVDKVLELTKENCENYDIHDRFDSMMMIAFDYVLDNIAKKNKYQEGAKILESDLAVIKEKVNDIITCMVGELEKNEREMIKVERMEFNAFDTLVAASDYLYALAMKKLGCPDMPTSFGDDVYANIQNHAKKLDEKVKKSYYDEEYSIKTYFDNQRRMDADTVRFNNKSIIRDINLKVGTPDQIAVLVAEYQALKLRQKGHGAIWRFFHKNENEERTQLLADMKAAIASAVGEDVSLEPEENTPFDIATLLNNKIVEKKGIEALNPETFARRCNCIGMIVYDQKPIESSLLNQEQNNLNVNSVENENRILINFDNGEFNENEGANILPDVSDEFISKSDPHYKKQI
jgi:hypothetical protein